MICALSLLAVDGQPKVGDQRCDGDDGGTAAVFERHSLLLQARKIQVAVL